MPPFGRVTPTQMRQFARPAPTLTSFGKAPATLKAYDPTIRDKLAMMLVGDAKPGSVRQMLAEGLFGSTGTGTRDEGGLIDWTPFGLPMQAQEAGRQVASKGQGIQGAINLAAAALPIPAAKGFGRRAVKVAEKAVGREIGEQAGAKSISKIADALQGAPPAPQIVAYHGSPHDFEQFSLDKIGTGEGAQSYGHGLYFAQNEDVAKIYRDELGDVTYDGRRIPKSQERYRSAVYQLWNAKGDKEAAKMADSSVADIIDRLDPTRVGSAGSMYQVGINADPEKFLDWDKNLSEQAPAVREAIASEAARLKGWRAETLAADLRSGVDMKGDQAYRLLAEARIGHGKPQPYATIPPEISDRLNSRGVPGIKYLDQGSRSAGEGSRNFVVFDPATITILKKYGWVPGAAIPAAAMGELSANGGPKTASGQPYKPEL